MNKKAYSGSVWPSLPPQVTFVLEITGLFLVWRLLLTLEYTPSSSFIGSIADVSILAGGMIVVIFICRAPGFTAFIRTFVYGGTTVILLPVIIGALSDTINQASDANPLFSVVVVLVCSSIVYAVCNLFTGNGPADDAEVREGTAACRTASSVDPTDRRIAAAHEAGHALMYAAWAPFPTQIQVTVKSMADQSGSLGYVRIGDCPPRLMDKNREAWEMLLSLAGMAGEQDHTGTLTSGGVDDTNRWLSHAVPWLVCHLTTDIYYPEPATPLELESNQRHLVALKAEHNALLAEFFTLNHDLHAKLTYALMPGETLEARHLHPYLAAVQLPDAFPRVTAPPEQADHETHSPTTL